MKNPTPRQIAFFIALAATGMLIVALLLLQRVTVYLLPWPYYFLPVLIFIVTYLVGYYLLEKFIYRKIKLIYKMIYDWKAPKEKTIARPSIDKDVITQEEEEVKSWSENKRKEIESLQQLAAYRRDFLSNVSHELKTPIFNIQGYLHTLLDGGLDDPSINREYLFKAIRNVDRLCTLVEDLETISQLESGEMKLEMENFDITSLAREVFEMLELQAEANDITLGFKEGCEKTTMVFADREKTRQVLVNLLSNAIKYGKPKGKALIGLYDMDKNVLIEVSDDGIGIPAEHLPRVFERFYRVDKSRSREKGGTGLGLSIVKHIVEAHGQMVHVRSTPGVGSTFSFTLSKGK